MATTSHQSALDCAATLLKRGTDALTGSDAPGVTAPDAIEAVQSDRRRAAIRALTAHNDDQIRLPDLASELAVDEYGSDYTSTERKRIYVGLYQTHIPKLESLDLAYLIEEGTDTIAVSTERLDAVAAWLDDTEGRFGGDL